jgi:hypothetical protein
MQLNSKNRTLVKSLTGDWKDNLDDLLMRTETLYGGIRLTPRISRSRPSLFAVVEGNFPLLFINYQLKRREEWIRKETSREYWVNGGSSMQICFADRSVVFFATDDLRPMIELYDQASQSREGTRLPAAVLDDMQISDLVAFLPDLNDGLSLESVGVRLPVEHTWVKADRSGDSYALQGHFELSSGGNSKGFLQILRLTLVYLMKKGEVTDYIKRLKGLEFEQIGSLVHVSGLSLSEEELVRFMRSYL